MDTNQQQPNRSTAPVIFFSAGEPSGDMHGANLIKSLRKRCPGVQVRGFGGPKMAGAGCRVDQDLTGIAAMWIVQAVLNIHKFWAAFQLAGKIFREAKPDAVVLIDFPGFNWWMARRAKKYGVPVFYYAPPQVWAWAQGRVKKMRKFVDHVLCGLPFEAQWYRERGCNARLVGHPYFDEVTEHQLDQQFLRELRDDGRPVVALLPGSRTQEVHNNFRWIAKAAARVQASRPDARFVVAAFKEEQTAHIGECLQAANLAADLVIGKTPEVIHASDCAISVSGSVSLELMAHTTPTVIIYWVPRIPYLIQRVLRKVRYITLVNLLSADDAFSGDTRPFDRHQPGAEQVLFPEYVSCGDPSEEIAWHITQWLNDEDARLDRVRRLEQLKEEICHPGAADTAAEYVLSTLGVDALVRRTPQPERAPQAA